MTTATDTLTQLDFFKQLSPGSQQALLQGIAYADCLPSDIILRQGQQASGAYIVLTGRLRVYSLSPNGNEATLYTIEPGETCVLALNCLFNDLLYPAWVESEANTQVMVIPGPLYRTLFHQETSVQNMTVQTLSTLVFRLMGELNNVHGLTIRQRLARLLLTRANSQGILAMTQQQLAHHLSTSREVVARQLSEFSHQQWIQTGRGQLQLLNCDELRNIAIGHDTIT